MQLISNVSEIVEVYDDAADTLFLSTTAGNLGLVSVALWYAFFTVAGTRDGGAYTLSIGPTALSNVAGNLFGGLSRNASTGWQVFFTGGSLAAPTLSPALNTRKWVKRLFWANVRF